MMSPDNDRQVTAGETVIVQKRKRSCRRPKPPASAFSLFTRDHFEKAKDLATEKAGSDPIGRNSQINACITKLWESATEEQKELYTNKEKNDRVRYEEELKLYLAAQAAQDFEEVIMRRHPIKTAKLKPKIHSKITPPHIDVTSASSASVDSASPTASTAPDSDYSREVSPKATSAAPPAPRSKILAQFATIPGVEVFTPAGPYIPNAEELKSAERRQNNALLRVAIDNLRNKISQMKERLLAKAAAEPVLDPPPAVSKTDDWSGETILLELVQEARFKQVPIGTVISNRFGLALVYGIIVECNEGEDGREYTVVYTTGYVELLNAEQMSRLPQMQLDPGTSFLLEKQLMLYLTHNMPAALSSMHVTQHAQAVVGRQFLKISGIRAVIGTIKEYTDDLDGQPGFLLCFSDGDEELAMCSTTAIYVEESHILEGLLRKATLWELSHSQT